MPKAGRKRRTSDLLALHQSGYAFRRAARIAARGLGARQALVIIRREGEVRVAGSHGFAAEAELVEAELRPFLSAVIGNPGVAVPDAREHAVLARSPLVDGAGGIRYAAGVSVVDVDYIVCGAVWVLDPEPRPAGAEDLTFLNDIASLVASYILPAQGEVRAERAEQRLVEAVEALSDGFVYYDAEDRLVLCNQRYRDVYAVSAHAIRPGVRFEEMVRAGLALGQYPDAVGREEEWLAERVALHAQPRSLLEQRLPEGRWVRIEEKVAPSGGRVGLRVDITELKQQQFALEAARAELALRNAELEQQVEERNAKIEAQRRAAEAEALLREAIEAMPDGFVYFDSEDRFVLCNRRYREMFACSDPVMVPGARYLDILRHDLDTGSVPHAIGREEAWLAERLAARAEGRRDFEQHLNSDIWVRTVDVGTADGGHVGLAIDVTDFKRQQFALMAAREELERQNEHLAEKVAERTAKIAEQSAALQVALEHEREAARAQRQFVAMVSHEFRTPLAIIDAAARRVGRRSAREGIAWADDYVEQMRGAVRRLIKLIESVLGAAKADAGTIEVNPVAVDLSEMVHAICADQRRVTPDRPFEVSVDGSASVVADPTLVYQILVNLIGNAVKYSPPASPVAVRLRCEGDDVAVEIADRGVGIPEDEIPRMFERFFRASTSSGIVGTGLGLNLSREIARMHGGDISLASTVGEGSTFTLRLRVAGPHARALPQASVA